MQFVKATFDWQFSISLIDASMAAPLPPNKFLINLKRSFIPILLPNFLGVKFESWISSTTVFSSSSTKKADVTMVSATSTSSSAVAAAVSIAFVSSIFVIISSDSALFSLSMDLSISKIFSSYFIGVSKNSLFFV